MTTLLAVLLVLAVLGAIFCAVLLWMALVDRRHERELVRQSDEYWAARGGGKVYFLRRNGGGDDAA